MKGFGVIKYIVLCSILGLVGLAAVWTDRSKDQTAPVFHCDTEVLMLSVNAGEEELLAGLTAEDAVDGDVTDSIIIEKMSRIQSDGSRTITYGAFDQSNNVAKYTRRLQYTDYSSPRFSLSDDLIYQSWDLNTALKSFTVTDCIDGDITNKMKLYSYEEEAFPYYTLTVYVTNSSGETVTQAFPVELLGTSGEEYNFSPKLSLSEYLIYRQAGEREENWERYLESVQTTNEYLEQQSVEDFSLVEISADVDMGQPGTYTVTYSYTDEAGRTGKTRLIVIVEE